MILVTGNYEPVGMTPFLYLPEMLKTITLRRCANVFFAFLNYIFLRLGLKAPFKTHAITISLELSSVCNLNCPECACGTGKINRQPQFMLPETATAIIKAHSRYAFIAQLFFQGEPMMNPHWATIANQCRASKLFTIINTNGHFLTDSNIVKLIKFDINRLIVSIDGIDSATYEKYRRGGSLEKVISGAKKLAQQKKIYRKKNPEIVFQTLVNKHTESQLNDYKSFAKKNGADSVRKKSMQLYDRTPENLIFWLPTNTQYQRYNSSKRPIRKTGCFRVLSVALYTTNGALIPCCFDKAAKFNLGNVEQNAWFGDTRKTFIQNLFSLKTANPEICNYCTEF